MTDFLPACPKCACDYAYEIRGNCVCPECSFEWKNGEEAVHDVNAVKDANGTVLKDGDSVIVIKDLKIKGSSSALKVGTKVKNIRLVVGDHDIDCKIAGIGSMGLKSEFVKKVE